MSRVLDLSSEFAVYSTRLLVECGHEVIRVEPRAGDALRRMGPFLGNVVDIEHGAYHHFFNAGKRSFSVDLTSEPGRDLLSDLTRTADAIVLSSRSRVRAEDLLSLSPRLVIASVDDEADSELLASANSGLLSLVGDADGEPLILGGQVANTVIGLYAAISTAGALRYAEQTGKGQLVSISAQGALQTMMEQSALTYAGEGRVTRRRGFRGEITAASSAFLAADGFWMLSVLAAGKAWNDFVEWVGDPILSADPSLSDEAERRAKQQLIAERLDAWSLKHPKAELIAEAQRRRIPSSPITNALEIAADEQLIARGYLAEQEQGDLGRFRVPRGAIATPFGTNIARAPMLGEHNGEILEELGYSTEEHAMLLGAGAL